MPPTRRPLLSMVLVVPVAAWMILVACGDGGATATDTDAAGDGAPDTSHDYGGVPAELDASARDGARVDDAAPPPPYCPAPVVCADAGTATTELARFVDQVEGIAADGCDIYWGDQGGNIRSVPRCGGPVRTIATGQPSPVIGLTVDAWSVYWTAGGVIRRASKGGGPFDTLASDPTTSTQQPWAIAVDAEFVYWTDNHGTGTPRLWRVPLAGGSPVALADLGYGGTQAYGMALDQGRLYFATDQIRTTLKDGGEGADLGGVGTVLDAWCIAVDDTDVYYTRYESGVVTRVPKAGGDASVFAPAKAPRCVAVDHGTVYWVNEGSGVSRAPTDGGDVTLISDAGGPAYGFITLDDAYVYWGFANRVMRAPK